MDDEPPVARALGRWLQRLDVAVTLLSEPSEFERVLLREQPTLIICDLLMPGEDGVALLGKAKRLTPQARRCLLTGSLDQVTEAQREALAPCLFLEKPWSPELLASQLGLVGPPP